MYHAVKFARLASNSTYKAVVPALYSGTVGKDTWEDWHLIPNERPSFAPPPVKTNFKALDGTDTSIDLTSAIGGYVPHDRRTGSWDFHVVNDYGEWYNRYSEIMNYLHYQECIAILEDDPGHFYRGRFSVDQWRSEKDRSRIVINYSVLPFKFDVVASDEPWLWDPFDFTTGVIRNTANIAVNGTTVLSLIGSEAPCQPEFTLVSLTNNATSMTIKDIRHGITRSLGTANIGLAYIFSDLILRPLASDNKDTYSSTSAYAVGDHCRYNGGFYRCNTAISSNGESWDASHWTFICYHEDAYGNPMYPFEFNGSGTINVSYRGGSL